jgi:hypothetical protein
VNAPIARKVALKYRFGGAARELEKTFPITPDETVLAEGAIRVRTWAMFRRLGDLRLTNQRLVIVSHYAFQPDRGFELPRGSITRVDRIGSRLTLFFVTAAGQDQMSIEEHFLLPMALAQWGSEAPAGL